MEFKQKYCASVQNDVFVKGIGDAFRISHEEH